MSETWQSRIKRGVCLGAELLDHMVILFFFFFFLRNCQIVFQNGCAVLHSHQHCKRVPISLFPWQYLLSILIVILVGVKWFLTVVLICIYLIRWASFHVFIGHLYILFGEVFIQILWSFKILHCLSFCWTCKTSLDMLDDRPLSDTWFASIFVILKFFLLSKFLNLGVFIFKNEACKTSKVDLNAESYVNEGPACKGI